MKEKLKVKLVTWLASGLAKLTAGTVNLQIENKAYLEQAQTKGKSIILAVWHGQLWLPAYYWQDRGYVGLASESRDGEYISKILQRFGWEMVRGSSSRGGTRSIIRLMQKLRQGKTVAITPDGPTGPRHEVKSGIIYLARKTDSVIIPVGVGFSQKKVFSSWDKFELPWPFAKAGLVYEAPIQIENELTQETKQEYQHRVKQKLELAGQKAEKILED